MVKQWESLQINMTFHTKNNDVEFAQTSGHDFCIRIPGGGHGQWETNEIREHSISQKQWGFQVRI